VTDTFGALLGCYAAFVVALAIGVVWLVVTTGWPVFVGLAFALAILLVNAALAIVVLDAFDRRGVTSDE
jgi:hypothetical protein